MSYVIATGICLGCGKVMTFNPNKVPSLNNQPICKACVEYVNPIRRAKGLPEITYSKDAYDIIDAEELP